jgi:phosphoribosyl-ATP pyrophosphohydrolase/phosphoribosyl-AMP cyclohydrolase
MTEPKTSKHFVFDEQGLLPAVVQDWRDGTVLMVGWMNREALDKTLASKSVHFWSRSRKKLWEKGETSGHRLVLKDLFLDCDGDTVLVKAEPVGPTCHTGERACFFRRVGPDGTVEEHKTTDAAGMILDRVYRIILDRKASPQADSYVASLFKGGSDRILKKVSEEAGEVLLASKNGKREEVIYEVADLVFHTLLVLGYHDIAPEAIYQELAQRFGKTGLRKPSTVAQPQQERRESRDRRAGVQKWDGPDRRQDADRRNRREKQRGDGS